MTSEPKPSSADAGNDRRVPAQQALNLRMALPGLVAIALYLFLLAGGNVIAVAGGHTSPFFLFFSALFIAAALGLLQMLRWAWALATGAVVMLSGLYLWRFGQQHAFPDIAQGLLNLVFFLYLVRAEVRNKLR